MQTLAALEHLHASFPFPWQKGSWFVGQQKVRVQIWWETLRGAGRWEPPASDSSHVWPFQLHT